MSGAATKRARQVTGKPRQTHPTPEQADWVREQCARYTPEYCGVLLDQDHRSLAKLLRWVNYARKLAPEPDPVID